MKKGTSGARAPFDEVGCFSLVSVRSPCPSSNCSGFRKEHTATGSNWRDPVLVQASASTNKGGQGWSQFAAGLSGSQFAVGLPGLRASGLPHTRQRQRPRTRLHPKSLVSTISYLGFSSLNVCDGTTMADSQIDGFASISMLLCNNVGNAKGILAPMCAPVRSNRRI